ncbi:hypothetical protein BJ878DRAFT_29681 [Calycina marina]|uniref:Uncharacterized protein n=1 Tax=Calycina marina TaxID=1763456 RepID=A0A9P8CFK3_9HELO|nr:hypothetical protein BJ878DRAFT_29681 [Calycina marina]
MVDETLITPGYSIMETPANDENMRDVASPEDGGAPKKIFPGYLRPSFIHMSRVYEEAQLAEKRRIARGRVSHAFAQQREWIERLKKSDGLIRDREAAHIVAGIDATTTDLFEMSLWDQLAKDRTYIGMENTDMVDSAVQFEKVNDDPELMEVVHAEKGACESMKKADRIAIWTLMQLNSHQCSRKRPHSEISTDNDDEGGKQDEKKRPSKKICSAEIMFV